jgi:hypothetical protein
MPYLPASDEHDPSMCLKCNGTKILLWWNDKNSPTRAQLGCLRIYIYTFLRTKFTQKLMKLIDVQVFQLLNEREENIYAI